ncbi:hypothetical protein PW52_13430 [Tamlana sedimentorum]|uniref:Uncharacterized protein n=1 Tax=Neotamlana sedimentorum TaxID=1435349 RepID=A0A0D7W8P3_9FLAO|nr:hypothetical protein [Tamlana sedimentorum]KJD34192.1 hypothetical protein PW52_13430 [Tamlana sedimentorum]
MKISDKISLTIILGYCVLHVLVLFQIIPHSLVWGGKIESIKTIYYLEALALVILVFLASVIMMKNRMVKPVFYIETINRILLLFAVFFMLNTVGNLLAESIVEQCQAIITLFLAILLFKSSKT